MRRPDPETLDMLAGEYVLGTLAGPARKRFERWIETDADVRDLVEAWQERLSTLAEDVPERNPSPHLWNEIARELGHKSTGAGAPQRMTRRQFWFGFGSAAATASVVGGVVGLVAWPEKSYAFPTHYAVLRNRDNKIAWIVALQDDYGLYQVHNVPDTPAAPDGKEDHLWMVFQSKSPTHFGAVADDVRKPLPRPAHKHVDGASFFVTFEDKGADRIIAPTAPPVYRGTAIDARERPMLHFR